MIAARSDRAVANTRRIAPGDTVGGGILVNVVQMNRRWLSAPVIFALILFIPLPVRATWSIVMVDVHSREVAIGSATCLEGFDLREFLPVVIVDVGAAAAQSIVDVNAVNRMRIHQELLAHRSPEGIIHYLSGLDGSHERRQYGISSVLRGAATFTGADDGAYADGVIGQVDTIWYSVQGNVLTGSVVIEAAVQAIVQTPGSMADKLMAAMEAARAMGGDGRCSCDEQVPQGCGAPPPGNFEKSAHVGFMIVARTGDANGSCTSSAGCATGDYYLNLNVANQQAGDLDPVTQLQDALDIWRAFQGGHADAVESVASIDPQWLIADGRETAELIFTLRDSQGKPIIEPVPEVVVEHSPSSAGISTIGSVIHEGGGTFHAVLTGGSSLGLDEFLVIVNDPFRSVTLMPPPTLRYVESIDIDRDGDVDRADYGALALCLSGPASALGDGCAGFDNNQDDHVALRDIAVFQRRYTAEACRNLVVDIPPQPLLLSCRIPSFTIGVSYWADPAPTFQWYRNGEPIPGATDPIFSGVPTNPDDLGEYRVELRNACGSIMSDSAEVTTIIPCQ